MEIDKTYLESKQKEFIERYKQATEQMNNFTILVRKYEGAMETIQLLLKEIDEPKNKNNDK